MKTTKRTSVHRSMTLPARHRKSGLAMAGVRNQDIADACGVDHGLVSRVIQGERLTSPRGQAVMLHIAKLLKVTVADAFPEYRPTGADRRVRSA